MAEPEPRSDERLVDLCNEGDEAAFEALYRRHRDWVVRLAWSFTRNEEDALDVLQETFAYLLGKLPHLRLTGKLTTLLFPAVKNLSIAARRKRERSAAGGAEALDGRSSPEPTAATQSDHLSAALSALPEGQREVILLRFVEDMSQEEIAGALAIPVGTVKSRIHNAIDALRADPRAQAYLRE